MVGIDVRSEKSSRIRIDPRGNIYGDDDNLRPPSSLCSDGLNQRRDCTSRRLSLSRTKKCVHDYTCGAQLILEFFTRENSFPTRCSRRLTCSIKHNCIRKSFHLGETLWRISSCIAYNSRHRDAFINEPSSDDETIAAVVSRPTQHNHVRG